MRETTTSTITLAALLALAGCGPAPPAEQVGTTSVQRLQELMQSNPCDEVPDPPGIVARALTGGPTYENEIHDCQRLVIERGRQDLFGPLVGIFPLDSAMAAPPERFLDGAIAASIYNWGSLGAEPPGYAALTIAAGWQCLWLRWDRREWHAAVTPVTQVPCDSVGPHPQPNYEHLQVYEFRHELDTRPNPPPNLYPRTARWGWDSLNRRHYMGIKCGSAWCSIGQQGAFQPRESDPLRGPKERSIPGWYDEQHLAVHDSTNPASPFLRPGPWGVIYPSQGLENTRPDQFAAGLVAAHIFVTEEPRHPGGLAYYRNRLSLETSGNAGEAQVFLQVRGSVAGAQFVQPASGVRVPTKGFRRLPSVVHAAQGAARWRWHENPGETGWIWCSGCCDSGFS